MPGTPVYGWPYQHRLEAPGLNPEAIERLALAIEATVVSFVTPIYCRVYRNAVQSIPNAADTDIVWDTEDEDNSNLHSLVTNPERVTIATAGRYLIEATCAFAANATGERFLWLQKNTSAILGTGAVAPPHTTDQKLATSCVQSFVAGDYVKATVFQPSGGALNLNAFSGSFPQYATVMTVTRLGS